MYSVVKSKKLLELLQELYQQNIISKEDKNKLAESIQRSFTTKSYLEVKLLWKTMNCLKEDKAYLLDDIYIILGGN
ncbi:hypothetical protein [Lacrimispora amygdalina]|uniref:hypothetical protein n=1 Tax=Lacrimispora amygdalina TaxID=253257 RepID=UPI000BE46447|nr:hypothetical protein [Lacrimispora amygdalina]